MHISKILVIGGSVRARRLCLQIAAWVTRVGRETMGGEFEIIDLKDWLLPMDDEPEVPAIGDYTFDHTRAWSRKISDARAFVFVTPQYNWGYPAPLKNALDHLYSEWSGKPAMIVTYGGHSGTKCARQLRQVLKGLRMRPLTIRPGFRLTLDQIKANTGTVDPAAQFAGYERRLKRAFGQLAARLNGARIGTWWWPW
jgi:NAD(P)H-dependent FMN reductase